MLALTYTVVLALAVVTTLALLAELLPRTIGSAWTLAMWLALVPSSFAVEITTDSGSIETVQQPVLAFLAVAGLVVTGLYLFADVTGRLSSRAQGVRS